MVIYGGSKPTGIDAIVWAKDAEERGAGEILLTSMETDGTKNGFDIAITSAISDAAGIPVIASGGVGNTQRISTTDLPKEKPMPALRQASSTMESSRSGT